jgi:hypothetical protein
MNRAVNSRRPGRQVGSSSSVRRFLTAHHASMYQPATSRQRIVRINDGVLSWSIQGPGLDADDHAAVFGNRVAGDVAPDFEGGIGADRLAPKPDSQISSRQLAESTEFSAAA